VQAWRVGDERAETYLRRLAEAELRRVGDELRRLDAAAVNRGGRPDTKLFRATENAEGKVIRAGQILVAAGVLQPDCLDRVTTDLHAALKVRSRLLLDWDRQRGLLHHTVFGPPVSPPPRYASQVMRVAPIGAALRGSGDRAPWTLHLLSLVRTETEAVIPAVMRMHWPPDGSSADLELSGAGPYHMPYDRLWAADDRGARYLVSFAEGRSETVTWLGLLRLSPVPPPQVRRLDLVGDGTLLIRLTLASPELSEPPGARAVPMAVESVATGPGDRLLLLEGEHILATGDARGPAEGTGPGEIITVLTEAGAIAAGSQVPGQLAALCQRLGVAGHGITVPAAGEIPAPWASVLAHRDAPEPAGGDVLVPLACVLPEMDGTRLVLAGLSTAAGKSHLHVVSSGLPRLTTRSAWDWTPGFSWWLRDGAGNWHVATTAGEPCTLGEGLQAFWLRLTPPLSPSPTPPLSPPLAPALGPAEIIVTGQVTRVRATVLP